MVYIFISESEYTYYIITASEFYVNFIMQVCKYDYIRTAIYGSPTDQHVTAGFT